MIKTVFYTINLLLMAFVVGTMFGIWFGLNPHHMSYPLYLEQQQQLIKSLNVKLPIIAAIGIVLTIVSAILLRKDRGALILLAVAAVLFIIAGIVTKFLNQPINAEVMKWVADHPPSDWMEVRDTWWKWHIVRLISGIVGFCLLSFGLLKSR